MALNIKNPEVERLAAEVATLAGESKTQAIRKALEARRAALGLQLVRRNRRADLLRFLEREVWPEIPAQQRGRRLTRREEDALLGYGREGV
jgi:antitoxin VapB